MQLVAVRLGVETSVINSRRSGQKNTQICRGRRKLTCRKKEEGEGTAERKGGNPVDWP